MTCRYCINPATNSLHWYGHKDWTIYVCDHHEIHCPMGHYDYLRSTKYIEPLVTFS